MEVTLTQGAIGKMMNGEVTSDKEMIPVLQVTELKPILTKTNHQEMWRMLLSDGTHLLRGVVLSSTLTTSVKQGFLQTGYIVRLTQFICQTIRALRIVLVLNLEVISTESNIIRHGVLGPNPNDTQDYGEVLKEAVFDKMKDLEV
ncbi:unnamed protein product [Arabis nemorensis]|uniref:Replication factor-A protein 1 N-terminal domain-containing protein n=1 Tax=Arabis nemorensis TaxID=586526 RepID=A0A565B667_9BRAS|nr:unnamed protein product [Arabis nemorensis]